jgi:hypothetical protein
VPTSESAEKRHSPKYIAGLALVAAAILVIGVWLKPREPQSPQSDAPPPVSQSETQRLARMAQRRALDTLTEHFTDVAGDLANRVVQVGAGTGSGLLWGNDLVLSAGLQTSAPESTVVLTPDGHLLTVTRSVAGPELPFAAYELPGERPPRGEHINESGRLQPAEWVLAVWHREGDLAFSPGHYLETQHATCGEHAVEKVLTSLALSSEMAGGGLFDLDGALVAVVLPCDEGHAALNPASISRWSSCASSPSVAPASGEACRKICQNHCSMLAPTSFAQMIWDRPWRKLTRSAASAASVAAISSSVPPWGKSGFCT